MSEPQYGPTGAGSVVLDVGGQIGALILHTPAGLVGAEIEISPAAGGAHRTHASVRAREGDRGTSYAAVYQGLAEGGYTVWGAMGTSLAGTALGHVTVTGGQITEHHLAGTTPY
jgi:hypothetical protein